MKFKAETVEQFKILKYIEGIFNADCIAIKLIDRYTVQVMDMDGEFISYTYKDGEVIELAERDPKHGRLTFMLEPLEDIQLTEKEHNFLKWLAGWEQSSVDSFISIITKVQNHKG